MLHMLLICSPTLSPMLKTIKFIVNICSVVDFFFGIEGSQILAIAFHSLLMHLFNSKVLLNLWRYSSPNNYKSKNTSKRWTGQSWKLGAATTTFTGQDRY
jgi:hypothetical protein